MIRCVGLSLALDLTYETTAGFRAATVNRPTTVHRLAGGKAANVARVVSALGFPSTLAGVVSGPSGAWFEQLATDEDLATDLVTDPDGSGTRLCVTVLGDPPTELYEPAPALGSAAWEELVSREAEAQADWTVVSGSAPPGLTVEWLAELVGTAAHSRPVALDAHGPVVADALLAGLPISLLKVNRSEAAALLGVPGTTVPEDLCHRLAEVADCELVVVTCGTDGSVALDPTGQTWQVSAGGAGPHPTGSGDAFLAALVLGLQRGDAVEDSLRRAAAAGAANAQAPTAGQVTTAALEVAHVDVRVTAR